MGGGSEPSPDRSDSPQPLRTRTPGTPSVTTTPAPPPTLDISVNSLVQGGFLTVLVAAAQASKATAAFLGNEYQLGQRVPGKFWGLVPVDGFQEPGKFRLTINMEDGSGGLLNPLTKRITVVDAEYLTEEVVIPEDKAALLAPEVVEEEAEQLKAVYSIFTPRQRWEGLFMQPAGGTFTSPYGTRRGYNGGPVNSYHQGLDIANNEGTPVVAANNGRVVFSGRMRRRGNAVIVDHGYGIFSGYNHMASIDVEVGDDVKKGDLVGTMGTTGLSTGVHLHWEIAVRGTTIDPAIWLLAEVEPPAPEPEPTKTPRAKATEEEED
jgi:murein DD-endopeptidase MepM/ murein hydrolase activator NlpD